MNKIEIPEGTDLNQIIKYLNQSQIPTNSNEQNFHFEKWIYDALPDPLPKLIASVDSPSNKDTALLASLTVLSALIKNYKVDYRGKMEDCQLYTYILGDPAQGKGSVAKYRKLGSSFHNQLVKQFQEENESYKAFQLEWENDGKKGEKPVKPLRHFLYLSGNSSKASITKELEANNGYGLIFETEADTLYAANKSDFGGFTDNLRKGFHSENLSVNRVGFEDGAIEIEAVILSVLLTSTLDQCFKLMPTYDNGLFSRFIFYILPKDLKFESVFEKSNTKMNDHFIKKTDDLFKSIGIENLKLQEKIFSLTEIQQKRFHSFFEFINDACVDNGQSRLLPNVRRLGLIFTRICMILTYLRDFTRDADNKYQQLSFENTFTCSDTDFEITLSIVQKLITHLIFLDNLYHNKNPTQQSSVLIHDKTKKYSNETKLAAIKLKQTGVSYADTAEEILGNRKLKATIQRWCESKKPFPVSETETDSEIILTKLVLENTDVSFFDSVSTNKTSDNLSLLGLLTTDNFSSLVDEVRDATQEERKKIKKTMPAFTPSGIFDKERKKERLYKHSKFICIDIDSKDNSHISNFKALKKELSKIINIAYIGVSVSGDGYFLFVPITNPEQHEKYFTAIEKAFSHLGIIIDKACKDVSRLRIVSYDPNPYISETTNVLYSVLDIKASVKDFEFVDHEQFNELIDAIEKNEIDITQSYKDWFSISCAIANTFDEEGRQYFHRLSKFYKGYTEKEADKQFDACLKKKQENGYTLSTLFYFANIYGINY